MYEETSIVYDDGTKHTYVSPARTVSTRYSSPQRYRTTTTLVESPTVVTTRSLSAGRRYSYSPVVTTTALDYSYVSPYRYSRYYDSAYYGVYPRYYTSAYDYPSTYVPKYYADDYYYSRYGYPYSSTYPYYPRYGTYADRYWSSTLGRYVFY